MLEFDLEQSRCLKLIKSLYGLCDPGDLWNEKHEDIIKDMGIKCMRSDPALYALLEDGILIELPGFRIEDLTRAGGCEFRELSKTTTEKFEMSEDQQLPCLVTGFSLARDIDGSLE